MTDGIGLRRDGAGGDGWDRDGIGRGLAVTGGMRIGEEEGKGG